MGEIRSHTALRGIAALLVVIYHYRSILKPVLDLDSHTSFFQKGYLWVDCFFMLSGFILSYVYGTRPGESRFECRRFLMARIARIYPLHLATLLFLAAFFVVMPLISHQQFNPSWTTFFLNLLDIHAWGFLDAYDWNFPSWSISVEFAAYLIFPLICIGLRSATATIMLSMIALLVAGLFIGRDNWERTALLHGLPMFFAGILIFRCRIKLSVSMINLLLAVSLVSLVAVLHFGLPDAMAELCFVALVFAAQFDTLPIPSPLLILGGWSYSIYMLHIPMRYVVSEMAPHFGPLATFVSLLLATLVAAGFSYRSSKTHLGTSSRAR
jgi:peptidoglycan/LPS O-acetylase OafA/YrhL